MILRCAIVDDEPLALGLLESYVNKTPFLQLTGKYSSAVQAMKELPGVRSPIFFSLTFRCRNLTDWSSHKW